MVTYIMLCRIIGHVKAHECMIGVTLLLGQGELGVYHADVRSAGPTERLKYNGALENEVHARPVTKLSEEGDKLYGLLTSHHLQTRCRSFPAFVDRDHHTSTGYGKTLREAVVKDSESRGKRLKVVQLGQRMELEHPDRSAFGHLIQLLPQAFVKFFGKCIVHETHGHIALCIPCHRNAVPLVEVKTYLQLSRTCRTH